MNFKTIFAVLLIVLIASCTTPAATPTSMPTATELPATWTPIPPTATPEPPTATATVEATTTPIPPTATATATATPVPPTATVEPTSTATATVEAPPAPAPVDGGDTAKTHPGGVVLSNGWVQYTSETYGGTTIAVPPDWWCIDYDPADQGKTVDAISAAANDQFGMLKMVLGRPVPDQLFYCMTDLDQFMSQQETVIRVFISLHQNISLATILERIDRSKWQVSEFALSGYDAVGYEGYDAQTERYERITTALLSPRYMLDVQSYSQSEARLIEVAAIEQAIDITLK